MKNRPIHENLDTSFVNLSALVRYLRRRQFAGQVRIELSGYEADIVLTTENQLRAREYDHIAGRVAEGEEALQRILIRAREPGGIINVYKLVADHEPAAETAPEAPPAPAPEALPSAPAPIPKPPSATGPAPAAGGVLNGSGRRGGVPDGGGGAKPKFEIPAVRAVINSNPKPSRAAAAPSSKTAAEAPPPEAAAPPSKTAAEAPPAPPKSALPNLPFEFTNKVETRAKRPALSADERRRLLALTGELLGTIDACLAAAGLDFASAFQKASGELAADYPFMRTLDYSAGRIFYADEQANPTFLVAGVVEALRRILDKLGAQPRFAEVHRAATQQTLGLMHRRRAEYDRFALARPLEKILGA